MGSVLQTLAGIDTTNGGSYIKGDGTLGNPVTDAWPIGSIYLSTTATNPATLLGFGTWAAIAAGRVLVGIDATQTEFDVLGETGGAKSRTLTMNELPAHTHTQQAQGSTTAATTGTHVMTTTATGGSLRNVEATASAGTGAAFSTLPPYLVISIWQRMT